MNLQLNSWGFRAVLSASALGAALFFAGAAPLRADDDCQKRIARADHKLHEAAEHHGWEHSHRWWDEDGHRWRTDRDWDDHDHDRH